MKRHYVYKEQDVPSDWVDRVVILWEEDDCLRHDPDAERAKDAAHRMFRFDRKSGTNRILARADFGDSGYDLYSGGIVICWSYQGGSVGVLVEGNKP